MQQPTDQSVDLRKDVPRQYRQYLDIALIPRQHLDTALVAGQYKIYCPAMAFDLSTQSVTYYVTMDHITMHPNSDVKQLYCLVLQ